MAGRWPEMLDMLEAGRSRRSWVRQFELVSEFILTYHCRLIYEIQRWYCYTGHTAAIKYEALARLELD